MADNRTVFQKLGTMFMGNTGYETPKRVSTYNIDAPAVLFRTTDKAEYEKKKAELRQQKLLAYQWVKASADNSMQSIANLTNVQLMYRDADLMDDWPEIGAALDIVMEETCCLNPKGRMINISSKSDRIKSILDDLFCNRLDLHVMLPMITREMVKYGNSFYLLNIDTTDGIKGWLNLPVYEMSRVENGFTNAYTAPIAPTTANNLEPKETKFIWTGHNESTPYRSWDVAHFRLLTDTKFLPYGTSWLHKARRSWRMLSMMEDAMLIYRLDKSIERRIFKINVGAIDENDVQAYIHDVANNFKRTPVIDPSTGQVDLRKNFLDVSADYFIPVRNGQDPSSIESLGAANNPTSMDDIEYMHNKILAALRVPKQFLNFQEAQGKGQNLSIMDIRFCRMIHRIQQSLLMELNKIAIIHLFMLGFRDDLTNFTLTLNSPSAQIEALELEDLTKRIQTAAAALADPGIGMPLMSLHKVLREVMKMDDRQISDMLNEIRLEKALAFELQMTNQVIKKTGIFAPVDRIYGDPNAVYQTGEESEDDMGGAGGAGAGGFNGGALPMDSLGGTNGMMGGAPMPAAPAASAGAPMPPAGGAPLTEEIIHKLASKSHKIPAWEQYQKMLQENTEKETGIPFERPDVTGQSLKINEDFDEIFSGLDGLLEE